MKLSDRAVGRAGIVTEIQRFSVHDGPGIRTTVFLKGCNLRCAWCHNPETLRLAPELQRFPGKCLGCGRCLTACAHGAQELTSAGRVFHRDRCIACGQCARGCYAEAVRVVGTRMRVEEVIAEARRDQAFYDDSGGGVTLSGGEPLCQPAFSAEILRLCKAEGWHTALETNLAAPWKNLAALLPSLDLVMLDLKLFQAGPHRRRTGVSNRRILANARRLAREPVPLIVRTPVIPGVNDTLEAIAPIAALIAGFPRLLYYELIPYHPLGTGKYESLDLRYRLPDVRRPTPAAMRPLADAARQHAIEVRVAR